MLANLLNYVLTPPYFVITNIKFTSKTCIACLQRAQGKGLQLPLRAVPTPKTAYSTNNFRLALTKQSDHAHKVLTQNSVMATHSLARVPSTCICTS